MADYVRVEKLRWRTMSGKMDKIPNLISMGRVRSDC